MGHIDLYYQNMEKRETAKLYPQALLSIPSVRPHFLSVRNHISLPIGQI